ANSVGKPTAIWAMQMNEERTALTGEKKELFRNDNPWEGNLVEGVSMMRHGGYFYAFYAANACCGRACTYGIGIARSKSLLGPWEKYQNNPVLIEDKRWKCPGHGTPVEKDGKNYFLYHAYDTASSVFTGRQGLLSEFQYTGDGWIKFVKQQSTRTDTSFAVRDEFKNEQLANLWQWSVFQPVKYQLKDGCLLLTSLDSFPMTFVGQKTYSGTYVAVTAINTRNTNCAAGIAAIGDERNIVSAVVSNGMVRLIMLKDGKETVVVEQPAPKSKRIHLQMLVEHNNKISFRYGKKNRLRKLASSVNMGQVDGDYLPPWDRAVRAGLVVSGKGTGAF
ncbi:MAG TPA: family 43 glycosylhydrolase, partial [Chitinophagaceae bacterium]|nr:family 43 glycosylhydrolase [Chitinophagaceae bacterium]